MSTKHAPGPWTYCYDNDTGPDDDYFVEFYSVYGADDKRIGQADNDSSSSSMRTTVKEVSSVQGTQELTDDEIKAVWTTTNGCVDFARAVIAAHKEKNK